MKKTLRSWLSQCRSPKRRQLRSLPGYAVIVLIISCLSVSQSFAQQGINPDDAPAGSTMLAMLSGGNPSDNVSLLPESSTALQQREISGTVTDVNRNPLPGVSITVKGTTIGNLTDINGRYSLRIPSDAQTLVFSFVGMTSQEIPVTASNTYDVTLSEDVVALADVVVIGYGSVSKKELTSAVSSISSEDFLNVPSVNPVMQIAGKVAGVSIINTAAADPNSSANIQVRGVSSRTAGIEPLVVINGVPGGNLQNINENDIESISILKDGAASSIYGTRGSNGVILVTTKKGVTDGQFRASYNGYVSFDVAKREINVLTPEEWRSHPERGNDFGSSTDWFGELVRTGVTQNHTLQFSGGDPRNNYRATIDVRDATGIDIRSTRQSMGARLSLNHIAANELYQVGLNIAPRVINADNADYSVFWQALSLNPTMPIMNPDDPSLFYEPTTWEAVNPVELLKLEKNKTETRYLDWDGTFRLNLLPLLAPGSIHTLNTSVTVAQQINDNNNYWFRPSTSTQAIKLGRKGQASQSRGNSQQKSFEWLVNYSTKVADHNIKVLGGYSYQYFMNTSLSIENSDFTTDMFEWNNMDDGSYNSASVGRLGQSTGKQDSKLIAFFGRLSYDYKGKYLATASLRYEGSSRFGANHKWGYFPAVSFGWMLSEENFMQDIGWINELKLRGDYGITGNQNFSNYNSLATMGATGSTTQTPFRGQYYVGWAPNRNPNPNLRWELGKNWNIGVDFALLNNRISGSFTYFNRTQQDLLGNYEVSVPPNIVNTSFVNVGTMRNTGIETEVNFNAVRTKDFSYNIGVIASTQNNKFISFSNDLYAGQTFYWQSSFPAPGSPGSVQGIEEGSRIGTFFTYPYAGVDELGNWLIRGADGEVKSITEGVDIDKVAVGNGLPKLMLSTNHSFKYKNFDLTLFFRGNFGYQVYNIHEFYWGLQSAAANLNVLDLTFTKNKHIVKGMNEHNSYFVQDADFLKLDVATLGYTIKPKTKWLGDVRVYFTGRNLLLMTGYDGVDPDIFPVNGLEPGVPSGKKSYYPATRQYLFGLRVNF